MTVHSGMGFGFAFGLMVAAILCVILFKFANSNRKIKTEYDERQEAIRNKGYKYSFYTVMALEAVMMVLSISEVTFAIAEYLIHFGIILVGASVLCIYCIWNDVYWGLNNNHKRYNAIIVIGIVLNLIPIIGSISTGKLAAEGLNSMPMINIMVIVWMAIIGLSALARKFIVKTEDEEG